MDVTCRAEGILRSPQRAAQITKQAFAMYQQCIFGPSIPTCCAHADTLCAIPDYKEFPYTSDLPKFISLKEGRGESRSGCP